ncbi:MAG TPA: S8 family serine peptidase [Kofleriaceae bacterium]|nr:S8 family serine peptidase [Kofleriaceae bacterium]
MLLGVLVACGPISDPGADHDRRNVIALGGRTIDTRAPDALPAQPGDETALVKFAGPVSREQLAQLSQAARIYTYLPHDTFLVRPYRTGSALAAAPLGAAWTGAYRPEYKIGPSADELAMLAPDETHTVMVTVVPDADLSRVAAAAGALPGTTVVGQDRGAQFSRLRLRVAGAALADATLALAAQPQVFWVDVEGRRELLNDTTVWVAQSGLDAGQTTPIFDHGIHGEGQVVGYIDTGIDADSCYFRDAALGLPPMNVCGGAAFDNAQRKVVAVDFLTPSECADGIAANEWDTQNHGSHVAGTIAGDNLATPIAHDPGDGMAPGAKLVVQDAGFLTDDCGDLPGIGCPVVDLKPFFEQAYQQGARIHTNSWGDNENAFVQNNYSAACQDVDEFMFNHPDFLILFAAGNSGPRAASVGSPSVAKNGISVGATLRGTQADSMAGFSSCGPTADGRFKPDLTMPGSRIISARNDRNIASNNCNTIQMSGTSMASPGAAGMAALVRQYYTDGFFPTGSADAADAFTPSAALIKATLLSSTRAMGGTGAGPVPDACQGWGRVLLDDALYFTGQPRRLVAVDDAGFAQGGAGEVRAFEVVVAEGQPLRATLAWTDFPSTPAASINLNNDLDLEVVGPSGTFLGNVLAAGQSTAGGAPDRLNNVEQVIVPTPLAGTYTIKVRAFNVPSSAQPFALVISGGIDRAPLAKAGSDATVTTGTAVTLDGSGSTDLDRDPLTFRWTQTGGPDVALATPTEAIAGFTPAQDGTYTFQLTVSDGIAQTKDIVVVRVADKQVVFSDDFEIDRGWRRNPAGKDTATLGLWERATPQPTADNGAKQLGAAASGRFDLVTGAIAGGSAGVNDVDGGVTSIQSPVIVLPPGGTATLSLSYYFAHLDNASPADFFRVQIVGDTGPPVTVIEELGSATNRDAAFLRRTVDITAFAGQSVRVLIQAGDLEGASLVEAAVDDVVIERQ